ncbi:hypothetical protein FRC12_001491 [Ceratobasidium sp. 428]|nr:hypothetical protein FRC12_001491 [Ceratobasidium sp. 428]
MDREKDRQESFYQSLVLGNDSGDGNEGEDESSGSESDSDGESGDKSQSASVAERSEAGDKQEAKQEAEGASKTSSEIGDDGRMRGPVYLDLAAKAERYALRYIGPMTNRAEKFLPRFSTKPHVQESKTKRLQNTENQEEEWTRVSQGVLSFRKRPGSTESIAPRKWSFSGDGATRQPTKDRAVGDIHFSPGFSGGPKCDYWVLHGSPKTRWVSCKEGHPHPVLVGYVLGSREGNKPPRWIRAQSLRANKCRGRKSI